MPRRYESCGLLTGKSSSVMDWLLEGDPFWLAFSTSLELFRHGQGFSLLSLTQSHSRIGLDLLDGSPFSRQPARNSIENRDNVRQNAIVTSVINPRKACRAYRPHHQGHVHARNRGGGHGAAWRGEVVHLFGGPTCIEFVVACDARSNPDKNFG